ncbi:MAG: hypothetical protein WCN98_18875 [Verrucomicrobiaceae bacterium]
MKTTIDIPDVLYKRVRIRAIERGTTLKQIVLASLELALTAMVGFNVISVISVPPP